MLATSKDVDYAHSQQARVCRSTFESQSFSMFRQFSLRTLFLLVTAVSVLSGWLGLSIRQRWEQRQAIAEIKSRGGKIGFGSAEHWWQRTNKFRELLGDDLLLDVVEVDWNLSEIDDEGLAHVAGMTRLRRLSLNSTKVTDKGLVYLQALRELQVLDLANTQICGSGLNHCSQMSKLEILALNGTQLDDQGAAHLRNNTGLRRLYLYGTRVTDRCVVDLAALRELESLVVSATGLTDEGERELRRKLPNTNVYRDNFGL